MSDTEAEELVAVTLSPKMREKWPRLRTFFPRLIRKGQYETRSLQPSAQDDGAPQDHYHLVYIAMVMCGMGFLIPWTSYIAAIDYFFYYYQRQFPAVSVIIPIGYLVTTFLSATLNLFLVRVVAIHSRIAFGYVVFIISLLMIPLLDIGIYNCTIPTRVSFYITLSSIALVGLASGVQQSSYYGLSSQLPRRYSQALLAGESVAGVLEISFRIVTKAAIRSARVGALVFFSLSFCFMILCVFCYLFIRRSKIVKFYTRECHDESEDRPSSDIGSENGGNAPDMDQQLLLEKSGASSMEMEETGNRIGCDGVSSGNSYRETPSAKETRTTAQGRQVPREKLKVFVSVVLQIWPLIGAIFIAFFVTLFVFPGLLSLVQNCSLGSWTPILLIAIFSFTDLVGRCLALLPVRWSPKQLLVMSSCRIILVPLVIMCVSPSPSHPVFGGNVVVCASFIALAIGLTNGYLGSLPLITLSAHVKEKKDREFAGTLMTWALIMGLMLGATCAYALTPLTTLQEHQLCPDNSTNTEFFDLCGHGNDTYIM